MAEEPSYGERIQVELERKRSLVRQRVTYAAIFAYLALAFIVVVWLMWAGRYEIAIGVLGGVAGLAGSISGFWFGSRRSPANEPPPGNPPGDSGIGPT